MARSIGVIGVDRYGARDGVKHGRNTSKLMRSVIAMSAGLVAGIATVPASAVRNYIATPLGTFDGTRITGLGIDDAGQVAGQSYLASDTTSRAFLYADGVMHDLGTLGGRSSYGSGISPNGQVTGAAEIAGIGFQHAFIYAGGTMSDLGTLGGKNSQGGSINNSGQVTGSSDTGGVGYPHAFLFSGGILQDLGSLGGRSSFGQSINAGGQVAGSADTVNAVFDGVPHAFFYSAGMMHDLGTLGGTYSFGRGVNDSGQVTGYSSLPGNRAYHGFIYSSGVMQDIGTLGGALSYGNAINADGEVVGFATTESNAFRAVLYSGGITYDLNSLVVAGLGSVTLDQARAINGRGQIVANGCSSGSICESYRLDPVGTGIPVLQAVEFYSTALDHYFVSALPDELIALDVGTIQGWARTGHTFAVYSRANGGATPVCRFYIPPAYGNSHFYSASRSECAAVRTKFPVMVLEAPDVFYIDSPDPDTGACPPGDMPVYRVWNHRADSNHRYTTSRSIRDAMVSKGYVAEGFGPDLVAMCAPL